MNKKEELLQKLSECVEFGKIDKASPYPPQMREQPGADELAQEAIAAGLRILTQELSTDLSEMEEIYIAGGFGSCLNLRHVVETGMIKMDEEKIRKMGNTALIGAKMFLYENDGLIEGILKKTRHIHLENDPDFQDIYIDKMTFS